MNDAERAAALAVLGAAPGADRAELERAFLRRNLALIRARNSADDAQRPALEAELAHLQAARAALLDEIGAQEKAAAKARLAAAASPAPADQADQAATAPSLEGFFLLRFGDWRVNTFVPPLLLATVWLLHQTPLKFFLTGFHVWVHELGHAVPAWLCGRWAVPIPFGWTAIVPEYSPVVHWGLLAAFGALFGAGWRERKVWPMVAAVALAGLQFVMTWRLPEQTQEFWYGGFGGVGGEFAIATLFMMAFFVQLPEGFRWGACRYVVFFIGASAFLNIWFRWVDVYRGIEEIPFGSLIAGEDDTGGDMNQLMLTHGWTKFRIRRTYYLLGQGCWLALGLTWAVFVCRLNLLADVVADWWQARREPAE